MITELEMVEHRSFGMKHCTNWLFNKVIIKLDYKAWIMTILIQEQEVSKTLLKM